MPLNNPRGPLHLLSVLQDTILFTCLQTRRFEMHVEHNVSFHHKQAVSEHYTANLIVDLPHGTDTTDVDDPGKVCHFSIPEIIGMQKIKHWNFRNHYSP